jgi:hypothetical protein
MAIIRPKITNEANGTHNVEFIALSGPFQRFAPSVREITRPGVDGQAYRLEGKRAKPFVIKAVRDASVATDTGVAMTIEELVQKVADFQGNLCTVKDEFGHDWTNVLVVDVTLTGDRPLGASVGGLALPPGGNTATRLLTWDIALQFTFVP